MPSHLTYSTYYPSTLPINTLGLSAAQAVVVERDVPNSTSLFGYSKPYSSAFSKGMHEPIISPTIPQCQISYGAVLQAPVPVSKKKFKVPLLSGIMGVLIPVDQYLLIPLQALNNLLL